MKGAKLYGLDLFSGIGGLSLGLSEYVRTVCYCETDKFAQAVLLSRMQSGQIDVAPIWDDVQTLRGNMLPKIEIIAGGFPCQDISVAGNGVGLGGKRSGLFFEIVRLTKEIRPSFVFLENVPAIRTRGLGSVIQSFTELGYDIRWTTISAASVGANHKRSRWFCLAYSDSMWKQSKQNPREKPLGGPTNSSSDFSYNTSTRLEGDKWQETPNSKSTQHLRKEWWKIEPNVGRVVDGFPTRVDRIKCLGNAVVPLQAKTAFEKLLGLLK